MKTQILECDIIVNTKKISIINSEMNIVLDWDVELEKTEDSVSVKTILTNLKGFVSFITQNPNYKKNTRIDFSTDSSWILKSKFPADLQKIEPVYSLIDFDEKRVTIEY